MPRPSERREDEDFSHLWLGSWKLHAAILVSSAVGLFTPLSSSAPLIAAYFPGAFIAASGWAIVRHVRGWSPVRQPVRTHAPGALYLAAATGTLFAAHAATGRDVYRAVALGSLWLTVPAVVLTALVIVFPKRRRKRADRDRRP
jgi:hypothetical protein